MTTSQQTPSPEGLAPATGSASVFRGLPPVNLCRGYAAWAGTVGIDAAGRLLVEAGEDMSGTRYVSYIASADDLAPNIRRAIADKMISLWQTFAKGGPNDAEVRHSPPK